MKEDTVWSMEKFNEYINCVVAPEKGLEKDWAVTTLQVGLLWLQHCTIYGILQYRNYDNIAGGRYDATAGMVAMTTGLLLMVIMTTL